MTYCYGAAARHDRYVHAIKVAIVSVSNLVTALQAWKLQGVC